MKKLSRSLMACSVFSMLAVFMIFGCKKDIVTSVPLSAKNDSPKMEILKNGDPSVKFSDLNAKITVMDGILVFETADGFGKTIDFLEKATPSEISKWENTLTGFTSVTKHYNDVRKAMFDGGNLDSLQALYAGQVILKNDGTIEPIIENGVTFGRIINEKGMYKVGRTTIKYSNNMVISILDGDESKLGRAISTLKQDTSNGIYIHPLKLGVLSPNSSNNTTAVQMRNSFCTDGCPISEDGNGPGATAQDRDDSDEDTYKMVGKFEIHDNSTPILPNGYGIGYTRFVNIHVTTRITLEKWVKPFLKSWRWSEQGTGIAWGFGWEIQTRVDGYNGLYPYNNINETGGWAWTVDGIGHIDADIPIWKIQVSSDYFPELITAMQNNGGITICAKRIGLRAEALQTSPTLSKIHISTYCQK